MYVLGIDPGLTRCGYGCVRETSAGQSVVSAGLIRTPVEVSLPRRLAMLRAELVSLLAELKPDAVVVERVLFQTNAMTAMSVGQASGLALATAAEADVEVAEYSSNEVKLAVTGYGSATKTQVQEMVARLLGLREVPRPPDVADALALAVCHFAMIRGRGLVESSTSPGRKEKTS
ncbi:MAG TPA: crossover junction endodeoxyribonuclease RuvC [Acidimicrobiales bacterium]|nr:crossover junction endodeoxyribonuclease RuvC [Acidimicrobiales bacterium]